VRTVHDHRHLDRWLARPIRRKITRGRPACSLRLPAMVCLLRLAGGERTSGSVMCIADRLIVLAERTQDHGIRSLAVLDLTDFDRKHSAFL
jgi:hypothetical protein